MKSRNLAWLLAPLFAFGLAACDVEQTQEGEMPEVSVNAEEGEMPEYDVDTAEVDVDSQERQVSVPDIDVQTEEKSVSVPDVDVQMPDDQGERQAQGEQEGQAPRG